MASHLIHSLHTDSNDDDDDRNGIVSAEHGIIDDDDAASGMGASAVSRNRGSSQGRASRRRRRRRRRRASSVGSSVRGICMSRGGLRLNRASLLAGRKRGSSTPVPCWKVIGDGDLVDGEGLIHGREHLHEVHAGHPSVAPVSARKLAAAFWEAQSIPFFKGPVPSRRRPHHLRPRHFYLCEDQNRPISPASSFTNHQQRRHPAIFRDVEIERSNIHSGTTARDLKNRGYGPAIPSDMIKMLNHMWSLEEQHKSSMLLVASLRHELDQCRKQLQELVQNEKNHRKDMENLTKKLLEERSMWQNRQEESIQLALQSISEELHYERKSKSRLESLHRKMVREFHDVKKTLGKALHDLERERKARELMEEVCDELAREIGEDKARVEELKRESAKVREEVEEERKMLQMAEIWREERVQMKLMEAKLEIEEKNAALDKLRSELENFLKARRAANVKDEGSHIRLDSKHDLHTELPMDVITSYNVSDPFHTNGSHSAVQSSADSQHSTRCKQQLDELEDVDDSSGNGDELNSFEVNGGKSRQRLDFHHLKDEECRSKSSTNQTSANEEKSRRRLAVRSRVLEQTRNGQLEGRVYRELYDDLTRSSWVDHVDMDESRKGSRGPKSFMMNEGMNSQWFEESNDIESSAINGSWLQTVESLKDFPATSAYGLMHQSYGKSSPTHNWNHFWSSLEPGSPLPSRHKSLKEHASKLKGNSPQKSRSKQT